MTDPTFGTPQLLIKTTDGNIVEEGVWDIIQPYVWKIAVTVIFFVVSTLCYFTLRNSQNANDIQNLKTQIQHDGQTLNQDQLTLQDCKTRIEFLEKQNTEAFQVNKMLVENLISVRCTR